MRGVDAVDRYSGTRDRQLDRVLNRVGRDSGERDGFLHHDVLAPVRSRRRIAPRAHYRTARWAIQGDCTRPRSQCGNSMITVSWGDSVIDPSPRSPARAAIVLSRIVPGGDSRRRSALLKLMATITC